MRLDEPMPRRIGVKRLGDESPPLYDGRRYRDDGAPVPSEPTIASVVSLDRELDRRFEAAERRIVANVMKHVAQFVHEAFRDQPDPEPVVVRRWPEWMRVETATEYLDGIHSETLRRWVSDHMPGIRRPRGRDSWYRKADIDALMEAVLSEGGDSE